MIPARALVVGVGATGLSCMRYLHGKAELFVTDTRFGADRSVNNRIDELKLEFSEAEYVLPNDALAVLNQQTCVVASPGIPLHDELLRAVTSGGYELTCDIDLFLDEVDVPIVGITGTNGKSTTTALAANMLKDKGFIAGGNIGTPVLNLLDEDANGFVLELSSFQLEKMKPPSLRAASILNISDDHLDHHGSMNDYELAKRRIYERCEVAVFNNDDPATKPWCECRSIVVNATNEWRVGDREIVIDGESISVDALQLMGSSNHLNIVIAAALAHACGADHQTLVDAACAQTTLPHRLELVSETNGVRYVNDSKSTNVAAACSAITGFGSSAPNILLIAGGIGKGQRFEPLAKPLSQFVKALILIGQDANTIGRAIKGSTETLCAKTLNDAVELAHSLAVAGDIVLLSPACASFDMFDDFQDRGNEFVEAVHGLAG